MGVSQCFTWVGLALLCCLGVGTLAHNTRDYCTTAQAHRVVSGINYMVKTTTCTLIGTTTQQYDLTARRGNRGTSHVVVLVFNRALVLVDTQ